MLKPDTRPYLLHFAANGICAPHAAIDAVIARCERHRLQQPSPIRADSTHNGGCARRHKLQRRKKHQPLVASLTQRLAALQRIKGTAAAVIVFPRRIHGKCIGRYLIYTAPGSGQDPKMFVR